MFKFYNIPDLETLEHILGDNPTIKFSSAFNLNDPYELKFNLTIDPFAEGQEEEFKKHHPGSDLDDFIDWQNQVKNNRGFIWYNEQELRNSISQTISLCSFSKSNKNNLMWSHYTNNHSGICVEYSDELLSFFESLNGFLAYSDVSYSDIPPAVDSLESIDSKILKMMFNKQKEWKYEQEKRVVILSDNDTDFIKIDKKYIKSIYIGSKSKNIENRIIEIGNTGDIDVFQGITLGDTYEVTFKKYKEGTYYMRTFWK